jgi:hypothetical protein
MKTINNLIGRIIFWSGYPGCVIHELAHLLFIAIFCPISRSMRRTKLICLKINANMFVMGLQMNDQPIYINDCIMRFLVAMAPGFAMLGLWYMAWTYIPINGSMIEWICYIVAVRGSLLCWPSDPDWKTAKYCLFRIWYTLIGEEKTYETVANIIAKDKYGTNSTPVKKVKKGLIKLKK